MTLRPEQEQAVRRTGQDVCVVAGPGSGKTRVLVERFAWLVEERVARPDHILAFTFTEKAATEIRNRLVERFKNDPELRARMESAWVSTVHGFCARLLRENAIAAGIDPDFVVFDEQQSGEALATAVEAALDELVRDDLAQFQALAEAVSADDLARSLAGIYQASRISMEQPAARVPPPDFAACLDSAARLLADPLEGWNPAQREYFEGVREWCRGVLTLRGEPIGEEHLRFAGSFECNLKKIKSRNAVYEEVKALRESLVPLAGDLAYHYFLPQRRTLDGLLGRIDEIYSAAKRERSALDFSDLERRAIGLLRAVDTVRGEVRERFDAILMDELQDTNPLQWELVGLIRRPGRFFAVGDVNQSIYGFRHAEPAVFRRFREEIERRGEQVDRLHENHRSRAEILCAVEAIVGGQPGIETPAFVPRREFDPPSEPPVEVRVVEGETKAGLPEKEARWVARRIRELEGQGVAFKEIAVLVRKAALMIPIEEALRDAGIPCLVSRGASIFEAQEVTDLVRWLRVVENPRDEVSLAAVLRSPLAGVTDATLYRLKQSGNLADGLLACPLEPEERLKLERFARSLGVARARAGYVSPDRLVLAAFDDCDYAGGLDARGRANVEKFLSLARELWADEPLPLAEFLEVLESYRQAERESEAPPADSASAVRVMSMHAAKGLEFPVVFLPSLQAGVNARQAEMCYSKDHGLGVRWRMPGGVDSVADTLHARIAEEAKDRETREADRLLFVAMTRAEQRLVLSWQSYPRQRGAAWIKLVQSAVEAGPIARAARTAEEAQDAYAPAGTEETAHVLLLDKPSRAGQYDSTSSVTALVRFADCPRQYFLGRYLGWQPAEPISTSMEEEPVDDGRDEISGAELGTAVHAWLAGVRAEPAGPEVLALAARFENSELGRRAARANFAEREYDFIFAFDDLVLRGQIDLWFEADGKVVLVDYKTDRFDAATRDERLQHYGLQLRFYAAALERMLGRKVDEAWLSLLREDRAAPVQLGPEEELAVLTREFRAAHEHLDFPLREGERCRRCEFYDGLCPAGRLD